MALRLIEIIGADPLPDGLPETLRDDKAERTDGTVVHRLLVRSDQVEPMLNALEDAEVYVLSVEAVLPPVEDDLDPEPEEKAPGLRWFGEVSLSEISERARDAAVRSGLDLALVASSSVLASAGMLQGN
ncbi:MAG: hypothetical protein AAF809_00210 [Bacteroidota bacterium]